MAQPSPLHAARNIGLGLASQRISRQVKPLCLFFQAAIKQTLDSSMSRLDRASQSCWEFLRAITRIKTVDVQLLAETELCRCLNLWDLTSLGKIRLSHRGDGDIIAHVLFKPLSTVCNGSGLSCNGVGLVRKKTPPQ